MGKSDALQNEAGCKPARSELQQMPACCQLQTRAPRNCGCKQKYNKEAQVSWYKVCVCGGGGNKKQKDVLFLLEGYCFCGVYWKCICLCGTLGSSVPGGMWFSSLTPSAPAVISHKRLWPDVIMADLQIPALPFLAQRRCGAIQPLFFWDCLLRASVRLHSTCS